MTEENKRRNISLEVARAVREFNMAQVLMDASLYEGAVSHAYYGAFHFARALILMEGLEAKSHSGVAHLVRVHFVLTGRIEPQMVGALSRLQADREDATYDAAALFNETMAAEALGKAREFADVSRKVLQDAGYI